MAETPRTLGSESLASRTLEQRLDAMGASWGGSSDPAAFSATALPAGGVGSVPPAGPAFLQTVAARRTALLIKTLLGVGGGLGVLALVVMLSLRVAPPALEAPPVREPERLAEPTFWNLRPGVQDPGSFDPVTGSALPAMDPGGAGLGGVLPRPAGVSPGSWPEDLAPK